MHPSPAFGETVLKDQIAFVSVENPAFGNSAGYGAAPKILLAAVCGLPFFAATSAYAQFGRDGVSPALLAAPTSQTGRVETRVNPACSVSSQTSSVSISALLPAAPVSGVSSPSARVDFFCNTPQARVSLSTPGAMRNTAVTAPSGREATLFTNSLGFDARAEMVSYLSNAPSPDFVMSNVASVGPVSRTVGEGTGTRRRSLLVQASSIQSGGLIPVAGVYSGVICVGVDPSGVSTAPVCAAPATSPSVQIASASSIGAPE